MHTLKRLRYHTDYLVPRHTDEHILYVHLSNKKERMSSWIVIQEDLVSKDL